MIANRYADQLAVAHDEEHLAKFEELLEAAVDLDRIPDEYLICASYDADLQVCPPLQHPALIVCALEQPYHATMEVMASAHSKFSAPRKRQTGGAGK